MIHYLVLDEFIQTDYCKDARCSEHTILSKYLNYECCFPQCKCGLILLVYVYRPLHMLDPNLTCYMLL